MDASEAGDQLAGTLGAAYRVRRELGGGGMSRVFLAHEEALGRDVVVKVLAPELAKGLSAERFAREIRLTASLQEPHIVPLLAAGVTTDGLPYYTMPFVRGESLRARLDHGRLPLADAVGVLRDVLRALAHAHAHGVVHRDIKPENVLLSSGMAVVTDFGIAKVLDALNDAGQTRSSGSFTRTTLSPGTPAYGAPEQAAGDLAIDYRADLYAWGVMAYELLAGQHPFSEKTRPQQLRAAHVTETPRALASVSGDVPAPLAALVMQCLAKKPDERPASAGAVLTALDAAVTAARDDKVRHGAVPTRRTLARALALYAVAFVLVAGLARIGITALALPDWVLPGALVVMALGLPVLLVTGLAYYQRRGARFASPRITAAKHATSKPLALPRAAAWALGDRVAPYLTWSHAAWGGGGALGVFAFIVAGYMALRAAGIGPAGSLVAAGLLAEREPLLVADFRVPGADTALGAALAEAVRTDLRQSRAIVMVPLSQVADALQRMQRPPTHRLDTGLAREVAEREGVRAVVAGDVVSLGNGYLVTMRLVSAQSGDELASFRGTAESPLELIPTLDRLSRALRGKIGESLRTVRADPPLARVTTASLPALRAYTAAVRAATLDGDYVRSAALSREAIAHDSTFAMAYRSLGQALYTARLSPTVRDSAFSRAYELRDRLTQRERLLATASFFHYGPGHDRRRAVAAYEAVVASDSLDHGVLNNEAALLNSLHDFAGAERRIRRTMAPRPGLGDDLALGEALIGQGKLAAAESLAALALRRFPNAELAPRLGVEVSLAGLEFDSAAARARRWRAAAVRPGVTAQAAEMLAAVARVRGRLGEGGALMAEMRTLRAGAGEIPSALADSLDAVREDLWLRRRPLRALARLDALIAAHPAASLRTTAERADALEAAALYAAAGGRERARAVLAAVTAASDSADRLALAPQRERALAEIALADGRGREALAAFRRSNVAADGGPVSACVVCPLPGLARSADAIGWADSARVFWERYATTPAAARTSADQWFLGMAYRRLRELYTAAGNTAKAAEYERLLRALWRHADAELALQVTAVRRRLAPPAKASPASRR